MGRHSVPDEVDDDAADVDGQTDGQAGGQADDDGAGRHARSAEQRDADDFGDVHDAGDAGDAHSQAQTQRIVGLALFGDDEHDERGEHDTDVLDPLVPHEPLPEATAEPMPATPDKADKKADKKAAKRAEREAKAAQRAADKAAQQAARKESKESKAAGQVEGRPEDGDDGTAVRRESETRADLRLLRDQPAVRAQVLAAVIVSFLLYTLVMLLLGRTGSYLVWLWAPIVLSGVLVGLVLDLAHRRTRRGPTA